MATENIFTTDHTPPQSEDTASGAGYNDGMKWRTSASDKIINKGRIWIPTAGKPEGLRWQLWLFASGGASTIIRDELCDELTGTPNTWMDVPTEEFTPLANTDYIVSRWIPNGGGHPYSSSGGPISPSGERTITAAAIYDTDVPSTSPPQFEGFSNGLLFADIYLSDESEFIPDESGWRAKVNRHCVYLQQKTVGGNTTYVKRRSATITSVGADDVVNIRIGHSGETYTNVGRKRDPDDNSVNVYISY